MKLYLEDMIIAWLRSQPSFANRSRFDLELLIGDLVRNIEGGVDHYVAELLAEGEADREMEREYEYGMLKAKAEKAKAKQAKPKCGPKVTKQPEVTTS